MSNIVPVREAMMCKRCGAEAIVVQSADPDGSGCVLVHWRCTGGASGRSCGTLYLKDVIMGHMNADHTHGRHQITTLKRK